MRGSSIVSRTSEVIACGVLTVLDVLREDSTRVDSSYRGKNCTLGQRLGSRISSCLL